VSPKSTETLNAIRRWEEKGLLQAPLGDVLRAEVEAEGWTESRRWSQYLLAGTGGAVLIIAAGTFLAWIWPDLGFGGQAVALAIVGAAVLALGVLLTSRRRWIAVAYLLQVAGPIMIVMAAAWSENAWPDRTPGGIGAGLVVLASLVVALAVALKKEDMLVALQVPLAFLLLFEVLDRTLGLDVKTCLWILDGLLVVALAVTAFHLRRPGGAKWLLGAFAAFLYAAVVLLLFSGIIVWNMDRFTVIPLDIWLLAVAGLSVWGQQESVPEHLRLEGYERQLAYCIVLWIPFGLNTTLEVMHTGPSAAALTIAVVGALGLWFALPRGSRSVLVASCLTLLAAAWYYGGAKAGALGAVLALTVMAGILFWASSRMSGPRSSPQPAAP
jgi:hypothetical protein